MGTLITMLSEEYWKTGCNHYLSDLISIIVGVSDSWDRLRITFIPLIGGVAYIVHYFIAN